VNGECDEEEEEESVISSTNAIRYPWTKMKTSTTIAKMKRKKNYEKVRL
jgi:hypothetical protein